ncbi:hypothetical protein DKT77_19330 [Meridianimarinicoccus roseus]|uniref:Uncharacterized protein n=1 Tax=Meridianimarinicoccus roseus TaxID=2072018 RepID=A0A2V2LCL7_9RHOB|nr:hypothetical protein DKT77_19330 [Meridianimarinicoccus roseus]
MEIPTIEDYDVISSSLFKIEELQIVYDTLDRHPAPHRAGPDSERIMRAWLSAARSHDRRAE